VTLPDYIAGLKSIKKFQQLGWEIEYNEKLVQKYLLIPPSGRCYDEEHLKNALFALNLMKTSQYAFMMNKPMLK